MWRHLFQLPTVLPILISQAGDEVVGTEESTSVLERLTPLNQIRVIVGLFTVVVLGLVLFIVIKAGSHMVKGFSAAANRLPADSSPRENDWAEKPLNQQVDDAE